MANRKLKDILNQYIFLKDEESFRQDIFYLAEKVFSLSFEELFINENDIYDDTLFVNYANRYLEGEPLYYILKFAPFYCYEYYVDNRVLIPRNETEELVYLVNDYIKNNHVDKIFEVGSGSGCISITLDLLNKNKIEIISGDISSSALEVANMNKEKLKSNVIFVQSDCLTYLLNNHIKVDVIVSNPPYIDKNNYVENSVLKYEPHLALFASDKGLFFYKKIISSLDKVLNKKGACFFEISPEQKDDLSNFIEKQNVNYKYQFHKDINGFVRFLSIYSE